MLKSIFIYFLSIFNTLDLKKYKAQFLFFFSSTTLLLPTHLPPPSCTHAQSCNPIDCSPPGSSVHGLFQARILGWVAVSFSKGQFLIVTVLPDVRIPEREERRLLRQCNSQKGKFITDSNQGFLPQPTQWCRVRKALSRGC